MRWHEEECINDGILCHPTDSKAWEQLDEVCPILNMSYECSFGVGKRWI